MGIVKYQFTSNRSDMISNNIIDIEQPLIFNEEINSREIDGKEMQRELRRLCCDGFSKKYRMLFVEYNAY